MLISFSVNNHLSFEGSNTLRLTKSLERQLPSHVCNKTIASFKLLKGAVVYGPNASGKSNFVFSLQAARSCVLDDALVPQRRAFRLSDSKQKPISFGFEFIMSGQGYAYSFAMQNGMVVNEDLSLISNSKDRRPVFSRAVSEGKNRISLSKKVRNMLGLGQSDLIEALMLTTPKDVLILSDLSKREAIQDKKGRARHIIAPYEWFRSNLEIVRVSSKPLPYDLELPIQYDEEFKPRIEKLLKVIDDSIDHIRLERYEGDIKSIVDDEKIVEHLHESQDGLKALIQFERRRFLVSKVDGNIQLERIVVIRKTSDGDEVSFELNEESEGTRRVIDLLPLFLRNTANKTLVIDELERSLHPKVTQFFHKLHYENKIDSQLILSTHEHYLLSQDYYRRDEIWFIDKDIQGRSNLYSLTDYDKVRFDKDIRKEYLRGSFGAIRDFSLPN